MHKRKAMKTFTKLFIKSYEDSLKNELAENGLLTIALRQSQKVKKIWTRCMQSISHRVLVSKPVSQTELILSFAPFFPEFVPTPSNLIKQLYTIRREKNIHQHLQVRIHFFYFMQYNGGKYFENKKTALLTKWN